MGYYLELLDPVTKAPIEVEDNHHIKGGTYAVGGTKRLFLTITYGYCGHFCRTLKSEKGIRAIYGMSGAESIPILKKAIAELGDDVDPDYWKPTEGNAKRALCGLLAFAQMRPDGIWDGD